MSATAKPSAVNVKSSLDEHGNPVVGGSGEEVARYDTAIDRLLRFHPDVVTVAEQLSTVAPSFAMGQVLNAYLCLMSTDVPDLAGARAAAASLALCERGERETAHLEAVDAWLSGDWHGAAKVLDDLLVQWPSDLLALAIGHQLDFFVGDAQNLRDRVGRSLLALDASHPHYGYVRGMQAFGLEESGNYGLAETAGLDAVERNADDVWAIHAVVHTYEMQGRVDEGIRFLQSREADWGSGNLFTVHNWWHLALYLLEAGRTDEVLRIYDAQVHNAESACVPLEMLDASALLWRLALEGIDTGDRFAVLSQAWESRSEDEPWYVFNDAHAVMALAGAGRVDDAERVIDRLQRYADAPHDPRTSNVAMTVDIGIPVSKALVAWGRGRYGEVVERLAPIRRVFHRFGGSHAQRDVLQRTLLDAAIRAGEIDLAAALTSERLSLRETSVYGWQRRATVFDARGERDAATEARTRAERYRATFGAAAR